MTRAGVASAWWVGMTVFAAGSPPPVHAQPVAACQADVARQLAEWEAVGPARPQPPDGGTTTRHWPTRTLGVWVVEQSGDGGPRLLRLSPTGAIAVTWSAECVAATRQHPRLQATAGPRFTDADLVALLAAHRRGVVYVWSPHMPLSIAALRALREAAGVRGLHVTVVLARLPDAAFAARTAAAHGWPADTLRVADSLELELRDVLVHAPTVLAYADGGIRGSAFPGAHTAEEYAAYLDRTFAESP
jgi:hypothetical protein